MSRRNPFLNFQLITYLHPYSFKVFMGWAASVNLKKAKALKNMVDFFIRQKFTEEQQQLYIRFYDSLTPAQRRNPAKCDDLFWDFKEKLQGEKNGIPLVEPKPKA